MLKTILIVAATAVLAFGTVWTASTVAPIRFVAANGALQPRQQFPSTKMPYEVKPDDLPHEYVPLLAGSYGFTL